MTYRCPSVSFTDTNRDEPEVYCKWEPGHWQGSHYPTRLTSQVQYTFVITFHSKELIFKGTPIKDPCQTFSFTIPFCFYIWHRYVTTTKTLYYFKNFRTVHRSGQIEEVRKKDPGDSTWFWLYFFTTRLRVKSQWIYDLIHVLRDRYKTRNEEEK